LSIPTKKGKVPWFKFSEGVLSGSLKPNTIQYEPSHPFIDQIRKRRKTQIRILAHPKKPDMICRFLLKMAMEIIASNDANKVFEDKYDKARHFALTGEKTSDWWYFQRENINSINKRIQTGIRPSEWNEPINLEVVTFKNGAEIFHFKFLYLEILTPLKPEVIPDFDETLKEPEYRLFTI
jgi:hypothetical protein